MLSWKGKEGRSYSNEVRDFQITPLVNTPVHYIAPSSFAPA